MGGHAETPPPLPSPGPVFLRARRCGGRDGAAPPPCPVLCVGGEVDPRHSCGGFEDGGRAVSNSSFGRGEVRTHLGTGTAAVWGTARPPSPPPPAIRSGYPAGFGFPTLHLPGGGAVSAWGCAVFVGLWLCEPGWGEALGCRAVASPPAAPPPPWRCPPLLSPSPCVVVALSLQTPAAELRKRTHSKAKLKGAPECRGGGRGRFRGGSGVGEAPLRAVPAVNPTARHSPAALL